MAGALRLYKLQLTGSSTSGGGALRLYKLQLVATTTSTVKLRLHKLRLIGNVGQFYDWNGTALAQDLAGSILYWDTASSTWK